MRFSERYGHQAVRSELQINNIDDSLRISLWNVMDIHFWSSLSNKYIDREPEFNKFIRFYYMYFLKKPLDSIVTGTFGEIEKLRTWYFKCEWYRIYDFIEFILSVPAYKDKKEDFKSMCNTILESEMAAYRIVETNVTKIIDDNEIDEIEEVFVQNKKFNPVKQHIHRSIQLLSDRTEPDYRNSIKESISAVESVCNILTNKKHPKLSHALDQLDKTKKMHPALKQGFSNLYGYTNTADGIRHSIMEEDTISFDDAKYFLVTCSAFINFVISIYG